MNSLGAYVASAATVRVPFDLIAAGTSAAIELAGLADDDVVAADVLLLLLLLQPAAASAVAISSAAASGFRALCALTRNSVLMVDRVDHKSKFSGLSRWRNAQVPGGEW
jgi:hypothetical protein